MLNLIKSDLKRIFKDKLFMIACIIAGAFAIFTPLMMFGLANLLGDGEEILEIMTVSAKSFYFNAFIPGGDVGLVVPILICIILCKDFSYGTIRNKIISGKSRTQVFFSMFISSSIVICGLMLAYALMTLAFSLLLVDYSYMPFNVDELWYLLFSTLLEMIVYVCISALVCFICTFTKSIGLSIVLYIGIALFFTIVGSIVQSVYIFGDPANSSYNVIEFLNNTNIFMPTLIGAGSAYTPKNFLYIIIPPISITILLTVFGNILFNKKDLK